MVTNRHACASLLSAHDIGKTCQVGFQKIAALSHRIGDAGRSHQLRRIDNLLQYVGDSQLQCRHGRQVAWRCRQRGQSRQQEF